MANPAVIPSLEEKVQALNSGERHPIFIGVNLPEHDLAKTYYPPSDIFGIHSAEDKFLLLDDRPAGARSMIVLQDRSQRVIRFWSYLTPGQIVNRIPEYAGKVCSFASPKDLAKAQRGPTRSAEIVSIRVDPTEELVA